MKVAKEDRADPNLTEQVKLRLSEDDYNKLRRIALINNTYISTMARRAIAKYLKDIEV